MLLSIESLIFLITIFKCSTMSLSESIMKFPHISTIIIIEAVININSTLT